MDETVPLIDLHWEGPFSIAELLSPPGCRIYDVPGLYIWVETIDGPHSGMISYVGKATGRPSLVGRNLQHFTAAIGCLYQIPEWARAGAKRWECRLGQPEVTAVLFTKPKLLALVAQAFDYVTGSRIYVTPFGRDLEVVERNLIWDLRPLDNTSGTKSAPPSRVRLRHHDATWLTSVVEAQARELVVA